MSGDPFPEGEYRARLARAQARMGEAGPAALLLSTEAELRYFSGFLTRFWESPTRPWLVPASGDPVAVIPEIGRVLMETTWIADIRCWPAPQPEDDGVTLLAATLEELAGAGGRVELPSQGGTYLRMPLADWARLRATARVQFTDDAGIVAALRHVKSEAEIAAIRATCAVANRAFDRGPEIARAGVPLAEVFRRFQMLLLEEGADAVPYLAGGAGPGGYPDVISPASTRPLARGDVLMLDTGAIKAGYFCDFDRNFSVGPPARGTRDAHARLFEAVEAGFATARPGVTAADMFHAMDAVCTGGRGGPGAGRLGHGLGMQLTEGPSFLPGDHTVLAPGMVLTLEPCVALGEGRIMVGEENTVLREAGAQWLSDPAPREIAVLEG